MNKTTSITAAAVLATFGVSAQAQEVTGRVISATPVVQQVQVPRQVCNNQPLVVQQPRTGAGAVIGAIAGAALGNTIGHGSGRAVATGIGLIGGAAVGDRLEGGGPGYVQNFEQCATQTSYENRTVGYNVTYEYGGSQYTVQMPNDPGPTVRLQVSPVGAAAPLMDQPYASGGVSAPAGTPVIRGMVASSGVVVGPGVYPAYYPAYAPAYAPTYYAPAYYPPVGISLGFGFSSGWGGGHRHHHRGHWR